MGSFTDGFEKQAGIIQRLVDKAKGLVTGKKYLYHGTSMSNLESIKKQGLKAGLPSRPSQMGISGIPGHEGKLFMATDKNVAKEYASGVSPIAKKHGIKGREDGLIIKATIPKKEFKEKNIPVPNVPEGLAKIKGWKAMNADIHPSNLEYFDQAGKKIK